MPIVGINNQKRDAEFVYNRNVQQSMSFAEKQEKAQKRLESAKMMEDAEGTAWKYVVEDDGTVCILNCRVAAARVVIPDEIEGRPVRSLEADSFKENALLEELVCADGIEKVGLAAFRRNPHLRRIVLPKECAEFDGTWLRDCPQLEEIVAPGQLKRIKKEMVDNPRLRKLVLGSMVEEVTPGMFEKSTLETIEVAEGNPNLISDGKALYGADGSTLVALAVACESYEVRPGTRSIAEKALGTFPCLTEVQLPDSVEALGEYAFTRAGITSFSAPKNLRVVGDHAFYNCNKLENVQLNDGLQEIGDGAFCGTPIKGLTIPSTVEKLGGKVADDGVLTYAGEDRTFEVSPQSKHFFLDADGGLYRVIEGGYSLVRMMNPAIDEYEILAGTRIIEERAFHRHLNIRKVLMPDGLEEIHEAAFRAAENLADAVMPNSMMLVGPQAFLDTSITSVNIGRNLTRIGDQALVTKGAHKGTHRTIVEVTVQEGNERFYILPGLLMERRKNGRERVLLGIDSERHVEIPLATTSVAAYALHGALRIRELYLSDRITDVEIRGLAIQSCLDLLHIDFKEPIEGHDFIELSFPHNDNTRKEINLAFGMPQFVDVETIASHYDSVVLNNQTHNMENKATIGLYEQATRALARLKDPLYLLPVNKSMYEGIFKRHLVDVCEQVARHDDRRSIDDMIELGFLTKDNISQAIERVSALQDAAMTGYLLEKKHEMVQGTGGSFLDDFEL